MFTQYLRLDPTPETLRTLSQQSVSLPHRLASVATRYSVIDEATEAENASLLQSPAEFRTSSMFHS